jgi:hypothetical protein
MLRGVLCRVNGVALLALMLMLALLAGCGGKKAASLSPTVIAAVPAPTPSPTPPPTPSAGPPPPVNVEPPNVPPELPKPQPELQAPTVAKHTTPAPAPPPSSEQSQHVTVPPGPSLPVPGQLSAALSRDDVMERRTTTAQLLEGAELNLKNLNRSLSNDEKAVLQHIRSYIKQSRDASDMGDVDRAYNLALKAHLLSEELSKR